MLSPFLVNCLHLLAALHIGTRKRSENNWIVRPPCSNLGSTSGRVWRGNGLDWTVLLYTITVVIRYDAFRSLRHTFSTCPYSFDDCYISFFVINRSLYERRISLSRSITELWFEINDASCLFGGVNFMSIWFS